MARAATPGLAEDPVGQVAADAGQQQAERDGPAVRAEPPAEPDHDHAPRPARSPMSTTVYDVPVLNAAPGLRVRCEAQQLADDVARRLARVRCATASTLVTDVDGVRRERDDDEQRGRRVAGRGSGRDGRVLGLGVGTQRRSSRCLHVMHSVARGNAMSPHLADRVAAGLADAVGAVGDAGQRPVDLGQLLALVVDARSAPGRARSWSRPCRPGRARRRHRRRASARPAPPPGR